MEYLIFSQKHTGPDMALFWRPGSKGYTTRLEEAGRYSEAKAEQICQPGSDSFMVPVAALASAIPVHSIISTSDVRRYLGERSNN